MKFLSSLHAATVHSFERYGHILYFAPMVIDHPDTAYGLASLAIAVILAIAAVAFRSTTSA